ncbi:hypothetical protein C0991_012436, partial [Blastosporella zonata]
MPYFPILNDTATWVMTPPKLSTKASTHCACIAAMEAALAPPTKAMAIFSSERDHKSKMQPPPPLTTGTDSTLANTHDPSTQLELPTAKQ